MRGFVFTLEAMAAIISLVALLIVLQVPYEDYSRVIVYKQASDIANALARSQDFGNASAMARQLDLRVRVTACDSVILDQSPSNAVRVTTHYYNGTYCELAVEASRQ